MKLVRTLWIALVLSLALVAGQQAAALHDLGHAIERTTQKRDSTPAKSPCNQHFLCAELSGAVASSVPQLREVLAACAPLAVSLSQGASLAPRLAFRSQAPPALL
jgi:hypothetical protein